MNIQRLSKTTQAKNIDTIYNINPTSVSPMTENTSADTQHVDRLASKLILKGSMQLIVCSHPTVGNLYDLRVSKPD